MERDTWLPQHLRHDLAGSGAGRSLSWLLTHRRRMRVQPDAGLDSVVMEQRVSLITLGVDDLDRAKSFYVGLGWTPTLELEDVVFFQTAGSVLSLWGRDKLAEDSRVEDPGGWGGVTLAHNVGSPDEVRGVIEQARAAGATVTREPAGTLWGGYSGVFVDPDGHPWEVAHNPGFELGPDGSVRLPTG